MPRLRRVDAPPSLLAALAALALHAGSHFVQVTIPVYMVLSNTDLEGLTPADKEHDGPYGFVMPCEEAPALSGSLRCPGTWCDTDTRHTRRYARLNSNVLVEFEYRMEKLEPFRLFVGDELGHIKGATHA